MADRAQFVWFDGKIVPWEDAKVHVSTVEACIDGG
jgi:hypothetical protein